MKRTKAINSLRELRKASRPQQLVNLVTLYRIIAFPFLLIIIFSGRVDIFKWLLPVSFLTDAVDGHLARKFKATSILGTKLDSIGDDLTVLAAIVGLFVFKWEFVKSELITIAVPLALFFIQLTAALVRYKKITSFHTYLAKTAAVLQGFFLCAMFLFEDPVYWLFYLAVAVTSIELIEEIILVAMLPKWKANVKGLYWVLNGNSTKTRTLGDSR